ncbi:hypothetical protein FDA25_16850 [Clostridium botulinum]|nr:hypothetical protein [Clostridium botulinum]NFJ73684.1 hypothetical protein [Clostridium botulinum]
MGPDEIREIIQTTLKEVSLRNSLIIALIPVAITMMSNVITNIIYDSFKRKSESKRKYTLEQLKELYLPLYSIISQSEYLRYFFEMSGTFEEKPFSQIEEEHTEERIHLSTGKIEQKITKIENEITKFNKAEMDRLIINKCQYASSNLIKLAVAHRYLEDNYLTVDGKEISDKFSSKEVIVLAKLVKLIIKETNEKLKYCNMKYDEYEIENSIMNTNIY